MSAIRSTLARGTAIAFVLAVAYFICAQRPNPDFAYACDPFGYLRQAELFRSAGFVGGLDTRVNDEDARFLQQTARRIQADSTPWSEMVAPHCHHYNATTDAVILQYPPGTGLALSWFPRGTSVQALYLASLALLMIPFAIAASLWSERGAAGFLWAAALASALYVFQNPGTMASFSVPLSLCLASIAALLAIAAARKPDRPNIPLVAILGLLCGYAMTVRVTNLFMVAGVAWYFACETRLWRWKPRHLLCAAAGTGGVCAGVAPMLLGNAINAGGVFATTYGGIDATPPILSMILLAGNARYYFVDSFAWPVEAASILALVASRVLLWRAKGSNAWASGHARSLRTAAGTALLVFLVSALFFLTHTSRTPYYMLPGSQFICCLLLFAWLRHSHVDPPTGVGVRRLAATASAALVGILCAWTISTLQPQREVSEIPEALKTPGSVIWSDLMSGTLVFYEGKYAAKINFGKPCMQMRMLRAVQESGRTQYFLGDGDQIASTMARLTDAAEFEYVGTYRHRAAADVFRFNLRHPENLRCTENPPGPLPSPATVARQIDRSQAPHIAMKIAPGESASNLIRIQIAVQNASERTLERKAIDGAALRISWRWVRLDDPGHQPFQQGWDARVDIPENIPRGGSLDIPLDVPIPTGRGSFRFEASLVREGAAWLHDLGMPVPFFDMELHREVRFPPARG